MTIEFQEELLKFLFQNHSAKDYVTYLDEAVFDSVTHQLIFRMWKAYVTRYKCIPSKPNFIEYFEDEWEETRSAKATDALKTTLLNDIAAIYSPLSGDTVFIKDKIINYAQKKLTRRLFTKNADKIANASSKFFDALQKETTKIAALTREDETKEKNRGHFYIGEPDITIDTKVIAKPCRFWAVNRMTNAGGFYAPQLVLFMKAAKAFGTGIFLNMVVHDLMNGEKVLYSDTENGIRDIYTRLDMTLLQCEEKDVKKHRKTLAKIKHQIALRGGEFKCIHFPGGISTMDDVDFEINKAYEETGFKPTKHYNDYIDKFVPADKSIKENRFKIRNVYEHQIRLNDKWDMTTFTISPVTDSKEERVYYKVSDLGEDRHKAYNVHACFALCCTEEEMKNGTMRITTVIQRQGLPFLHNALTTCALKVDRATNVIEEIDSEVYLALMELDYHAGKPKRGGVRVDAKDLVDE